MSEELKKDLRENIQKMIDCIEMNKKTLENMIEELYILEKGSNRPIGWKKKGRELGFVL